MVVPAMRACCSKPMVGGRGDGVSSGPVGVVLAFFWHCYQDARCDMSCIGGEAPVSCGRGWETREGWKGAIPKHTAAADASYPDPPVHAGSWPRCRGTPGSC